MSPEDKAGAALRALRQEVDADLSAIDRVLAQVAAEVVGQQGPTSAQLALFAVGIDRAYSACEAIFVRVARAVDRIVPEGPMWHASLLHQMTLPIQDVRPPVLAARTARGLEELLRFRHFLRHSYRADLQWSQMRALVLGLPPLMVAVRGEVQSFLSGVDGDGGGSVSPANL